MFAICFLDSSSILDLSRICPILNKESCIPRFTVSNCASVWSSFSFWLSTISTTSSIVSAVVSASCRRFPTIYVICCADSADCSASFCICDATTAKPRPCSPARAASIEAFNDNRLVSSAIAVIISTALWISCAEVFVIFICSAIVSTAFVVFSVYSDNSDKILLASVPALPISLALCAISEISSTICSIISPICFVSSIASSVSSACDTAPREISLIAVSSLSESLLVSSAACSSSSAEPISMLADSCIFLIISLRDLRSFVIPCSITPISSLLRIPFPSFHSARSPSATLPKSLIICLSALAIAKDITAVNASATRITTTLKRIILTASEVNAELTSTLSFPVKTMPAIEESSFKTGR